MFAMANHQVCLMVVALCAFMALDSNAFSINMHANVEKRVTQQRNTVNDDRRSFLVGIGATAGASLASGFMSSPPSAIAAPNLPATEMKAPDFELPNSRGDGNTSLQDLTKAGKWTVLYFYPGAFTSGCTLEARGFQRDMSKYGQLNTQIVGVSVDPVEKNASFCSSEGLDFYMLTDQKGVVSKLYGSALSVPGFGTFSNRQTYIIDPNGTLKWVFTDVESRVPKHSEEVLLKLEELQKA